MHTYIGNETFLVNGSKNQLRSMISGDGHIQILQITSTAQCLLNLLLHHLWISYKRIMSRSEIRGDLLTCYMM